MEHTEKSIGAELRRVRTLRGKTQADIAGVLGCAPATVTNWENDKVKPSLENLSRMCTIYGISALELLPKQYTYDELLNILRKPVERRSYEEMIATNFSYHVFASRAASEDFREEADYFEGIQKFVRETELLERVDRDVKDTEILGLKEDYEENGGIDKEIIFAYHMLTKTYKKGLLTFLVGCLAFSSAIQQFFTATKPIADFTAERIKAEIERLSTDGKDGNDG